MTVRVVRAPLAWLPLSALVASVAAVLPAFPLRELVLVAFVGVGPGWAFLSVAGLRDRAAKIALTVPVSLSIAGLAATTVIYLNAWSPIPTFLALAALTSLGAVAAAHRALALTYLLGLGLLPAVLLVAAQLP